MHYQGKQWLLVLLLPVLILIGGCSSSDNQDDGDGIIVTRSWQVVGSTDIAGGAAADIDLCIYQNIPYIIYSDYTGTNSGKATVMQYSGLSWTAIGSRGFTSSDIYQSQIAVGASGVYTAFTDTTTSDVRVFYYYPDTTSWIPWGRNSGGAAVYNDEATTALEIGDLAFKTNGYPYLVFTDNVNTKSIVRYATSAGSTVVGEGDFTGFSEAGASLVNMAIDSNVAYVAYRDPTDSKVTVQTYSSGWSVVGAQSFSADTINGLDLAVSDGIPYVAYNCSTSNNRITVMKYTSGNWTVVGTAAFTPNEPGTPSITVYQGTPYVAFLDSANGGRITVKKLSGSSWVDVGNPGFSQGSGTVGTLELVINYGTPYVAYDTYTPSTVNVMKYE
jgi:hypothetical protein